MQFRSDFGAELTAPSLPRPVNQHETGGGATARIGLTFCRWSIRTGGGALTSGRAIILPIMAFCRWMTAIPYPRIAAERDS